MLRGFIARAVIVALFSVALWWGLFGSAEPPLEFRRALVTGVGRANLGRAFVEELCRRGVKVAFTVRSLANASPHCATASLAFPLHLETPLGHDSGRAEKQVVEEATALLGGPVDLLIANHVNDSGYVYDGLAGTSFERSLLGYQTNTLSYVELWRHVLAGGSAKAAVWVSSASAEIPERNLLPYQAAKAALNAFARSYNAEAAPNKRPLITIVHGPMIATSVVTALYPESVLARLAYEPSDVARKAIDGATWQHESVEFMWGATSILRAMTALSNRLARWAVASNAAMQSVPQYKL